MNHIIDTDFAQLTFNGRLLLKEMHRRGIKLKLLGQTYIVKASLKDHNELLYDVYTALTPYPIGVMIDDKYYTKKLLEKYGYSVPIGQVFMDSDKKQAIAYASTIGYPVVLKPTIGSHGDHVYLDIQNDEELERKIDNFIVEGSGNGYFLIEQQIKGEEYRLFITKDGFFAAVHRAPASVLGNGKNNLLELVEKENYRRMHPRDTCLCEIRLDEHTQEFLRKEGLSLEYVPKKGERVVLRKNSNVSTGGNCYEVTDQVHSSVVQFAQNVLSSLGLPFVGIDLLCDRIDAKLIDYAICELNGAPGLSLHMLPESGPPQDTAKALVDLLFPETK